MISTLSCGCDEIFYVDSDNMGIFLPSKKHKK
jgi:hypothetical protein